MLLPLRARTWKGSWSSVQSSTVGSGARLGQQASLHLLSSVLFQSKNNRPLRTSQIYAQDENATHTQLFTSHFDLMKTTAGKRSPPIKPLCVPSQAGCRPVALSLSWFSL